MSDDLEDLERQLAELNGSEEEEEEEEGAAEADDVLQDLEDQLAALDDGDDDGDSPVAAEEPASGGATSPSVEGGSGIEGGPVEGSDSADGSTSSEEDEQAETLQDRVDSALGSTDEFPIRRVLDEAAAARHAHPSLNLLKEKYVTLAESSSGASSPAPNSTRQMSVAETGVRDVIDLAGEAARLAGAVAEEVFLVRQSHNKKAAKMVELKVGQINVQCFDGPNLIGSWLLAKLSSWEYVAEESNFVLHTKAEKKEKPQVFKFECSVETGALICDKILQMAVGIVAKQKADLAVKDSDAKAMGEELEALKGVYAVQEPGLLLRATKALDSAEVGTINAGETIVVDAVVLYQGRTRVHMQGFGANLQGKNGSQDVMGWASLKTSAGRMLIAKMDADELEALREDTVAQIEKVSNARLHTAATISMRSTH